LYDFLTSIKKLGSEMAMKLRMLLSPQIMADLQGVKLQKKEKQKKH